LQKAQKIESIIRTDININKNIDHAEFKKDNGLLGKVQNFLKKNGKLYYFLLNWFAPVLVSDSYRKAIKRILKKYGLEHIILNIGSGPIYIDDRQDIINVDICKYDEVDVVADIINLPIEDEKIDLIINLATLEHIDKAEDALREMFRILKPGGEIFSYVPFIVPFHGAPQDFHRWTILGIEKLFAKFEILKIGIGAGPTSGMLWIFQEWLAILFSFGSKILHDIILMVLMVLTMPLKFIDMILVKFPNAEKIASGFYIVAEKKKE
jgi:SAM-dependent methyltransferase